MAGTGSRCPAHRAFCEERGEAYLPADQKTISAFTLNRVKPGKPATIRRYVATIPRIHVAAGLLLRAIDAISRLKL
jgi:hypothetical protein